MRESKRESVTGLGICGFHTISYQLWQPEGPAKGHIICAHGLTRNSHDFDPLAQRLSETYIVACPDIVGRGQSSWLPIADPYDYPQYLSDMNALTAQLHATTLDWIGTSMGGLIGMMYAAMPNSPIRRLIINDVGPLIKKEALDRIAAYTGVAPSFQNLGEVENYLRKVHAPFHPMTDENWKSMALHGARQGEDGQFRLTYDPKIGDALRQSLTGTDIDLWHIYDAITCPVLLIRGANSDLLDSETAQEMTRRGPEAELIEIEEAGHAPSLMSQDQISLINEWLK